MFGDVELRTAKLRTGVRDAEKQFQHLQTTARHAVTGVERELNRMGKFKANLNQGFMSSFGIQGGGGTGSLIGSAAGNLLQTGTKALFGHVTEAIDKGLQMKDLIEQMRIAFTNLTGSEEKAVAHMREMFKFGADTPFQTRDLLLYSQQLQAVGIDASNVKSVLTDLGDAMAKAGTFQRMDKAMLAVTQMLSKGKITGEELNQQLSEALPGARGYMARGLGVTQPELNKLLEEGRVSAEAGLKLMFMQMRLEAAGTMKETATKTLAGLESTLEDAKEVTYATGVTGGDPFGPAGGAYAQRMANLKTQIGNYSGPGSAGIATKVGGQAETYLKGVGMVEENAFKSATGRDTIMKMFTDPKGAAADIYNGLTQGLSAGTGVVTGAMTSLAEAANSAFMGFWEIQSPSKRAERLGDSIREGLEIGLNKRQAGNYAQLKDLSQREPEFVKKMVAGSVQRGINPDHLANLLAMESSFNPHADNPNSSAYGLIQWMESTRKQFGLTQQGLSRMNATQQLDQVFRYFDQPHLRGKLGTQAALYSAVGAGQASSDDNAVRFRRGSKGYEANKVWDVNKDGVIRQGEFGQVAHRALGAGEKFSIAGIPISSTNPMPVAIVDALGGGSVTGGGARGIAGPQFGGTAGLNLPIGVGGTAGLNLPGRSIAANLQLVTTEVGELNKALTITPKPLIDVKEALKGVATLEDEMAALRKQAITPEEAKKAKKDKLFDKAFTKEGVAGDFQGGLQGLLGNLGWEKPTSLLKQFAIGMIRDIQGRLAQDLSASITGSLFGNRNQETGGLSGGLLSSIFGKLFGGGRASGGPVSAGRLYMVGENGPELLAMGGSGHVYNQRQMSAGGEQRTIVAIGDRAVGEAVDAYRNTGKGKRTRIIQGKYMRKLQSVSYA